VTVVLRILAPYDPPVRPCARALALALVLTPRSRQLAPRGRARALVPRARALALVLTPRSRPLAPRGRALALVPRARALAPAFAALLAVPALTACWPSQAAQHPAAAATYPATQPASSSPAVPTPTLAASPSHLSATCPSIGRGFSCTMREHIAAVVRFLRSRPGVVGIVLRDHKTGAIWRNKYAGTQIYMASTSKLAMVTTLLLQDHLGNIHLSSTDRSMIHQMLHISLDSAADDLWFKYGASFYTRFFPEIGLTTAHYLPQAGVNGPYWGEMTCTAEDNDRVINYVLDRLPASLRTYMVAEMRHVGTVQHFGVWGAGPRNEPGNKDGWSTERPGWIVDSVGFAGPGAGYTLTMMNSLNGQGGYAEGTDTVTQIAALLFQGHHVLAPTLQATP